MKEYLVQFKPFLLFLAKFAVCYLLLTFVYQNYLNQFDEKKMEVDGFTHLVANQSQKILFLFDSNSHTAINTKEASVKLYYKGEWVARIIEGCNALSVIILFVSFVIAFKGKVKATLLFILFGSLLVHVFNVFRIALLCIALDNFPEYDSLLHDVVFPLVIYGLVFLLWIIWVNKYSFYAEIPSEK